MSATFEFLCRMGDSALILGHRVSEWCGHAPQIEEDIALANIALDLIGQATLWLGYAAEVEGKGRSADDLAFRRDVWEFRNLLLVEQPNRDFAHTMMRQYLFDQQHLAFLQVLSGSDDPRVAEIAAKSVKEVTYHLERSRYAVVALGDGSEESRRRMQGALDRLWPFAGEAFGPGGAQDGLLPQARALRDGVRQAVSGTMAEATLTLPESDFAHAGGLTGKRHSEHLGHLLSTMQILPRSYPEATW